MGFAAKLKESNVKTNNHPATAKAKATLRRYVLDAMRGHAPAVFDAFAGDGQMWQAVWREADHYVGCDMKWYRDEREAFVCDNRRVLRAIDLQRFNIFDLDAYGAPWEQALIISARRVVHPGERIGLVITEGSALHLKLGGIPASMRIIAGVQRGATGGGRSHDELMDRCIAGMCKRMKCKPVRRWIARDTSGAKVVYVGLILEGISG